MRRKIIASIVILLCIAAVATCLAYSFIADMHSIALGLGAVAAFLVMLKAISVFCEN